jgi:hypothetical protein
MAFIYSKVVQRERMKLEQKLTAQVSALITLIASISVDI